MGWKQSIHIFTHFCPHYSKVTLLPLDISHFRASAEFRPCKTTQFLSFIRNHVVETVALTVQERKVRREKVKTLSQGKIIFSSFSFRSFRRK